MYPKNIYFCNKRISIQDKICANNWKKLNPEYKIILFDNFMCQKFLLNQYGPLFVRIFNFLQDGPIKADFWRICILYKYGGIYSDIDNEPLIPLNQWVENNINFLTCSSYWKEKGFKFNPNFIISSKNNPILKKCINWYIYKYINKHKYNYWNYSIMNAFTKTLLIPNYNGEGIYTLPNNKIQIIKEHKGVNHYDDHNTYKEMRVFNNRYKNWNYQTHTFK